MKTRPFGAAALFLAGLSFWACGGKEAPAPPENRTAAGKTVPPYYYDLGSAVVDASGYPERQKEGYRLFLAVCGSCHTTARPLNSPHTDAGVWKRYARRMHIKMQGSGIELAGADEDKIVEFLVYDSKIRKIDRREEFESSQKALRDAFETLSKEAKTAGE